MRARTTGWVSLGISPTDRMQGADMLIGWFGAGLGYAIDTYSTGPTGPHPNDTELGGTFDLLLYNATQTGQWTTVELVRLLTAADAYDKPVPRTGRSRRLGRGPDRRPRLRAHEEGTATWHTRGTAPPRPRRRQAAPSSTAS